MQEWCSDGGKRLMQGRDLWADRLQDRIGMMPTTYSPKYVFREGTEPLAYQVFKSENESSEIVHADCASNAWEREFPLYEDDLAAARCADDLYCPTCDQIVVLAQQGDWNGWHAWLNETQ